MMLKFSSLVCVSLLIFCHQSCGQRKANQKCSEYGKVVLSKPLPKIALTIVGGTLATANEFPHMAALGFGPQNNLKWFCGGTLISPNFVLTAAHCLDHQDLGPVRMVKLGSKNLQLGTNIEVLQRIRHPNYKPPSQYNDIALLKLKSNVEFSTSVFPACLNSIFKVRSRVLATGWGLVAFAGKPSDNLMKVDLNIYSHKQCNTAYRSASKAKLANGILDETQVCAGGRRNEEKDTCQGDSGGPLVMKGGKMFSLIGITSFGKACGIAGSPGVYTRVSAFIPWIENIVWS